MNAPSTEAEYTMAVMNGHTQGPWYAKALGNVADQWIVASEANGRDVAICGWASAEETQANAELICKAVNAHDALVAKAQAVVDAYGCECLDEEPREHCPMCLLRAEIAKAEGR